MSNEKEITDEQKKDTIQEFVSLTAEHALALFTMMGLKTHIECMVKNDADGAEYLYSFRKMSEGFIPRIDILAQANLKLESDLLEVRKERDLADAAWKVAQSNSEHYQVEILQLKQEIADLTKANTDLVEAYSTLGQLYDKANQAMEHYYKLSGDQADEIEKLKKERDQLLIDESVFSEIIEKQVKEIDSLREQLNNKTDLRQYAKDVDPLI